MNGGAGAVASEALDVTIQATLRGPARVRTLVKCRLAEWGLTGVSDDVVLIASELVANAAQYASEQEIHVRLTWEPGAVVLAVWDSSDARPVCTRTAGTAVGDPVPDAEALDPGHDADMRGRGLPIVAAMAEECWVTPAEPHGKWVCVRYATVEPAAVPSIHAHSAR
ncbi:ATP-binding protein [Actinomadura darangshiensis]|nr:ATP-binding protein [Actinomadura darangshiensis]